MTYAFTPVPLPTLPIKGSDKLFPIHRIYCVGRNYAEHTKEMGGDTKDPPFFFQKNPDNIVTDGKFPYPPATQNLHFEIELVVGAEIGRREHQAGRRHEPRVRLRRGHRHDAARPAGRGQEAGAPVGGGQGVRGVRTLHRTGAGGTRLRARRRAPSGSMSTASGGRPATSSQMIWDIPNQIAFLSTLFELKAGRPHLHRHAGRRRRHQEGRQDEGPRRRRGRSRGRGGLTRTLGTSSR